MAIKIPQYSDILATLEDAFTKALGTDTNFDPSTPTGQLVNDLAASFQSLYQALQESYSASRVDQAEDEQLDDLVALLNIKRTDGEKTVCKSCQLTGTDATVIPAQSRAGTTDGIVFYSSQEVTIAGGTAVVDFISEDYGQFTVEAAQLTEIVDAVSGWTAITNPNPAVGGSDHQDDTQLRNEVLTRSQNLARGYEGSIKAAIQGVAGVLQAYVYVNYTNAAGPAPWSAPAHTVLPVIQYSDRNLDPQIAEAIFTKLPATETFNSASATQVTEPVEITGGNIDINWNIATELPVNFIVDIRQETTFTPDDKQTIIDTITNFIKENATISGILYYSKIYAAVVNSVPDVIIDAFLMSTNPTPISTDITDLTPKFYEIFTTGTIEIDYGE